MDARRPLDRFLAFPRLPFDLRWIIWRMAICTDETPRIHYYSLFNEDVFEGHRQSFLRWMISQYPPTPPRPHPRRNDGTLRYTTNPRLHSLPSQFSWTRGNRFLYYWDAGLWTASKESRAAIYQYRLKARNGPLRERSDIVMAEYGGGRVYLEVQPRDIVCLRFNPDDLVKCVSLDWRVLLVRLPFFHLPQASDLNLAFEFHDSWDDGIETNMSSLRSHLLEPSERGLVMRAYWAWVTGKIPRWTRLWLIDRGGRIPDCSKLGRESDGRYKTDDVYGGCFSRRSQWDRIFIDGRNKCVESYRWDREESFDFDFRRRDVPVSSFIWKLRIFCGPRNSEVDHVGNLPESNEHFFRVLRPLPGTDGTG
ncbi:hypothetical protein HJFPF1_05805 [Paramyrothecium foliicola]|nr:hypothetical protein HJFPF1_05805 [Paramyrothecium foliicola]